MAGEVRWSCGVCGDVVGVNSGMRGGGVCGGSCGVLRRREIGRG